MKRGGPLRRRTPLKAKVGLTTKKALERRTRLRAKPKPKVDDAEREAMAEFGRVRYSDTCAVCGRTKLQARRAGTKLEAHHVVPKQKLKQVISARGLSRLLLWDKRWRLLVCGYPCHSNHTTAFKRIPRVVLPESALLLAKELGLTYVVEREYPRGG